MYFPDRGCVRTLRTLYVYATVTWWDEPGEIESYMDN